MRVSFFPSTEAALVAWAQTFANGITADYVSLGLTSAQCSAFSASSAIYASSYTAASNPNTRSKALVAAKNASRDAMKSSARLLASIISGQATVTDQQKLALGLNVRGQPQNSAVPQKAYVKVLSVDGRMVKIALSEASSASARHGLPDGVQGATVFSFVGAAAPDDVDEWTYQGNTGRALFDVASDASVPAGATIWLTAFYFNGRKQSGQAAGPTSTQLAGGMARMAA